MASSSTAATAPLDLGLTAGTAYSSPPPPPPTPSNHSLSVSPSPPSNEANLSRLLRQLTPTTLSPPPLSRLRRASSTVPADPPASPPAPPTISLLDPQLPLLSSAATNLGFFHLCDHGVSSELAAAARLESPSLLLDSHHRHNRRVLGFDLDDDDDDAAAEEEEYSGFLVFDADEAGTDTVSVPSAVAEFAKEMGKAGVEVVEKLLSAAGLKSPFADGEIRPRCLMWLSSSSDAANEDDGGEGRYPYAVCLQYEMGSWRECAVSAGDEPGEVAVSVQHDSVLVAVGDIAQVWSNGRFKKVRGRPSPSFSDDAEKDSSTLSLLVTLPTDSVVSPLPLLQGNSDEGDGNGDGGDFDSKFCSFPFEQYTWRLYNEHLAFKDPLNRYRI